MQKYNIKRSLQRWYFDKVRRKINFNRLTNSLRVIGLKLRCQHVGRSNNIDRGVTVVHGHYLHIGNGCTIHKDTFIHIAALDKKTVEPIVKIGDNCHLSFRTWIAARAGVTIEDDVLFAPGVVIQDYDHAFDDIETPVHQQPLVDAKPIRIGRGAFLAANVVVTGGVTIGTGSVIGANSVVTADVPDYCLAVGCPARVIKRYNPASASWERIN